MTTHDLDQAIGLIKTGEIELGGEILVRLLQQDPDNEIAWEWLHLCARTDEQSIYCLNKVLELNPDNQRARTALEKLSPQPESQSGSTYRKTRKDKLVGKTKPQKKSDSPPKDESQALSENSPPSKPRQNRPEVEPTRILVRRGENLYDDSLSWLDELPEFDSAMFGNHLSIGGVTISPYDYPECVEYGHPLPKSRCHICEFFSEKDCPIRRDQTIIEEVHTLYAQRKRYWQEYHKRSDSIAGAIYTELKDHGRPLHYELLAQIMQDRYPHLKLTPKRVLHIMRLNPNKFRWVDNGVYKAK
jgi:hypothetical protein